MSTGTFYITTPIYYVNGLPHIGHAYTTIAADTLRRFHQLLGRDTFLLTGTDEHGQKVLEKAKERGLSPKAHCDDMVVHWKQMMERLNVGDRLDPALYRFIRTTDVDHEQVVQAALRQLWDKGLIEKREYEGWYYIPDEAFVTEKDVEEGKYDREKLIRLKEANYFFLMSRYQDQLLTYLQENPNFIQPESRRNEVLGFLRKPLGDLCISRPKARMSWGIELPFDADFVTYVWFDALLNYLTGIGWHPEHPKSDWLDKWSNAVHLLGKDILTTHAVYWSTMLMALEVPLPKTIFAHGWWVSSDGQKMSKSLGNTIDVGLLVDNFGVDATRYFLLREIAFGADGGFSYEGFLTRYNADLANDLGNLAHRALSMTQNWLSGIVPQQPGWGKIQDNYSNTSWYSASNGLQADVSTSLNQWFQCFDDGENEKSRFDLKGALEAAGNIVKRGNLYVDQVAPWALNKAKDVDSLKIVLRNTLETCFLAAATLLPVMPEKMAELLKRLGSSPEEASAYLRQHNSSRASGSLAPSNTLAMLDALEPKLALTSLEPISRTVFHSDPLFPRFQELPESIAALFTKPSEAPVSESAPVLSLIEYEDFAKIQLRSGTVVSAEKHPQADRLLVLKVDVGEDNPRTIVAGIASKFAPEQVVGRKVVVVINLKPAKLRGIVSEGMLLAAGGQDLVDLVHVDAVPGTLVR